MKTGNEGHQRIYFDDEEEEREESKSRYEGDAFNNNFERRREMNESRETFGKFA